MSPSRRRPLTACADAGTRYQRYSCVHGFGHAFMRLYADQLGPALGLCSEARRGRGARLRAGRLPRLLVRGEGRRRRRRCRSTPMTDPRQLCGTQPAGFVRPCWYRAFLEIRPAGFQLETPQRPRGPVRRPPWRAARRLHHGGRGDRAGRPGRAARRSAPGSRSAADAASCVRGTKVQNLLEAPMRGTSG